MVAKERRDIAEDPFKDAEDRLEKIKQREKEKDKELEGLEIASGRWKVHKGGLLFA